jgi:enoyl-CoA hydratase
MSAQFVRVESSAGISVITLDRPKALNALNSVLLQELEQALASLPAFPETRALILTGAGEKAFVAGADIAEMVELGAGQAQTLVANGHRVMNALEALPYPTIAAVNGFALGGGCELALACDLIYASDNAKFGLPEVGLGVIPGFGGTQRLTRRLGPARAKELIFTGDMIDAPKAKTLGLALEVLPLGELISHCRNVAGKIAKKGPLAVAQAKRVITQGADSDLSVANLLEQQAFSLLFGTQDQREGMKAFVEKRQAAFKGA